MLITTDPFRAWRCSLAAGFLCVGAAAAQTLRTPLPDSAYVPAEQLGVPGADDALAKWFAAELRGADEPALYGGDPRRAPVVYRLATFGGWGGVSIVRLERRAATWTLVRKRAAPARSGQARARSLAGDSVSVPSAAADRVVGVIMRGERWRRPAPGCRQGFDGYEVLLEARDEAGYTLARCWVPDEATAPAVMATVRAFEELAQQTLGPERHRAP